MGAIVRELRRRTDPFETPGVVFAFFRFGTYEDVMEEIGNVMPPKWNRRAHPKGLAHLYADALWLSRYLGVLEWCERATEKDSPIGPLPQYVGGKYLRIPLKPSLSDVFRVDENGDVALTSSDESLKARIGPELKPWVVDPRTGGPLRLPAPPSVVGEAHAEEMKRNLTALEKLLRELKAQIDRWMLNLYWAGGELEPSVVFAMRDNPLVSIVCDGIILTEGDRDFALADGKFIDRRGEPYEPGKTGPFGIAHVVDAGEKAMGEWRDLFVSLGRSSWMWQQYEPAYPQNLDDPERYRDACVHLDSLKAPGCRRVLPDILARRERDEVLDFSLFGKQLLLGDDLYLRPGRGTRDQNGMLFLLDQLTAEQQVAAGRLSAAPAIACASSRRLSQLIRRGRDKGRKKMADRLQKALDERKKEPLRAPGQFAT